MVATFYPLLINCQFKHVCIKSILQNCESIWNLQGSNPYCLDKNFGAWLIIWDRMFGTFQEELPDVPIVYGLVDPVRSFNPVYLQVYLIPFVRTLISYHSITCIVHLSKQVFYYGKLYDKWKSMVGWKNKIFSLVKGPGWRPGSPWTGFIEEVPDVMF